MNQYLIQYRIKTVAYLPKDINYLGFTFAPFDLQNRYRSNCYRSGDWLATKEVEARDFKEAIKSYQQKLLPTLDALSVQSQCSFSMLAASFLVSKQTKPERCAFIYLARDTEPVGMQVRKEDIDDLDKLMEIKNKAALFFFRQSNSAVMAQARLSMLIIAGEALAGQTKVSKKCPCCSKTSSHSVTNKVGLKNIFGDELYKKLYKTSGGSLRHKIFHGNKIEDYEITEVLDPIYNKLLAYIESKFKLKNINHEIKNPPRTFKNFESGGFFVRNRISEEYDLRRLEASLWSLIRDGSRRSDEIEIITPPPVKY